MVVAFPSYGVGWKSISRTLKLRQSKKGVHLEKETAFWEAVVAIAPLLGLTLVLEIRQTRWQEYGPGWRVVTMLGMCLPLLGLAWAAAEALEVLFDWDPSVPPSRTTASVILWIVQLSICGVLIPPISHTFFVFFGRGAKVMRRLDRAHRSMTSAFKRHHRHLVQRERALLEEVADLVLANPGAVFHTSGSSTRVQVTDPKIQTLRAELEKTRSNLQRDTRDWLKMDKRNRKLLKRADEKVGISARVKLIERTKREAS